MTGGKGFDDIVVLAPVPALIAGAVPHLAEGGLMNIFAGVPRGTIATIDLSVTFMKGNRFVGSSGSRPQDMVDTLEYTETGELPTKNSLAAIGGIDALVDGVWAVKQAKFPGKDGNLPAYNDASDRTYRPGQGDAERAREAQRRKVLDTGS